MTAWTLNSQTVQHFYSLWAELFFDSGNHTLEHNT